MVFGNPKVIFRRILRVGYLAVAAAWLLVACGALLARAETTASGAASSDAADGAVVATVGGEPVYAKEVSRLLGIVVRGKPVNPQALPALQAQTLEEIVDRRLVLAYARRTNRGATPAELEAAHKEFLVKLQSQRRTLAEYLKGQGIDRADLERQLVWNVIWEKYLARYVTAERLAAYFQAHRRDLDGTEALAGQILLKPADAGPQAMEEAMEKARRIREEIVAGKISFADAAKAHSSGPSARQGGELGWIGRHGAMGETFCRAVFALEPGQVSEPVKTPFGVSLIRVDRYKPGPKQLADVRKAIQESLARELMEKLADAERPITPVVFTGKTPYFKAGTHELVVP
jgi:parvulin-like peptidyl-prolyl isomerase